MFSSSQARSWYLSLFSISFNLTLWSAGTAKSTVQQVLFFLFFAGGLRLDNLFIIIIIIIVFSHHRKLMVFHWSLSDSKSPQVSRTLLSILAVLNNPVVWMVSTRPPTSKSSSPFSYPLVTVPKAPITIGIIVTNMFHSFFNSLARSRYLSFYSHSFSFILWSAETAKSTILQVLFLFSFFFFFC